MEWGVAVNTREPTAEIAEKALIADVQGLDSIWITDFPAVRHSPILASIVARITKRIRIGVGLLSPFIYPPEQIVQFMSTLIEHYGDRFDLLIGPGDKYRLTEIGIEHRSGSLTVRKLTELLTSIRKGLTDYNDCRIFLGAQGEKMIENSRVLDGVILNYSDLEMIRWAIAKLGNVPDAFGIGVFPPTLITDSNERNNEYNIRKSAGVVALGLNASLMKRFGLKESLNPVISLMREKGKVDEDVISLIEKDIIDRFSICGDMEEICERVRLFEDLGVRSVVFGPPQGTTVAGVRQLVETKEICE